MYEPFVMESTVVTEYNLVCGDYMKKALGDSLYSWGFLVGEIVFGVMADLLGRRWTLLFSLVSLSLGNLLSCALPHYLGSAITRMLSSAGLQGKFKKKQKNANFNILKTFSFLLKLSTRGPLDLLHRADGIQQRGDIGPPLSLLADIPCMLVREGSI